MKGTIIAVKANGQRKRYDIDHVDKALPLLQSIVGGNIEAVPYFSTYLLEPDVGTKKCVAFCNEEGKLQGLPLNIEATMMWWDCLGCRGIFLDDQLYGSVALVSGDEEFMKSL